MLGHTPSVGTSLRARRQMRRSTETALRGCLLMTKTCFRLLQSQHLQNPKEIAVVTVISVLAESFRGCTSRSGTSRLAKRFSSRETKIFTGPAIVHFHTAVGELTIFESCKSHNFIHRGTVIASRSFIAVTCTELVHLLQNVAVRGCEGFLSLLKDNNVGQILTHFPRSK